jgi:hypothetical protein
MNEETKPELLPVLIEAVDMAETLVASMDYLGTGTDHRWANKCKREDEEIIARFRAVIAAHSLMKS